VAADQLALGPGQLGRGIGEQAGQLRAGTQPGPRGQHGGQRRVEPGPGARREQLCLVGRHAEHVGQVGAGQLVPHGQLDDLLVFPAECGQRGRDQLLLTGLVAGLAGVGDPDPLADHRHVVVIGRPGDNRAVELVAALVAGHREQPRPQPARVA
jgi:hypothetical protein